MTELAEYAGDPYIEEWMNRMLRRFKPGLAGLELTLARHLIWAYEQERATQTIGPEGHTVAKLDRRDWGLQFQALATVWVEHEGTTTVEDIREALYHATIGDRLAEEVGNS